MRRFIIKPVVWNDNGYISPSGVTFSSGFAKENGYGHEEWNNSPKLEFNDGGEKTRAFHTEPVGRAAETNGENYLFLIASHRGQQCLVSVAGRATALFEDNDERERIAELLNVRSLGKDAWAVPNVQEAFGKQLRRFESHWGKVWDWVPTWKCPANFYLALKAPVPLDARVLTGKLRLTNRYNTHQDIDCRTALAILDSVPKSEDVAVLARLRKQCSDVVAAYSEQASELADDIADIESIPDATTRAALVQARLGQGKYRAQLERLWGAKCSVTGCGISKILRASHVKPWRDSDNQERLDPENGLLLVANLDALFDCGLISFADDGRMLVSKQISRAEQQELGLGHNLRKRPSVELASYLRHHREAKGFRHDR